MSGGAVPVFLDRDGTLIVEKQYLSDPAQVSLEEGVVDGLRLLRDAGHPLIVLSNQSGIGRGKFTTEDAQRVNARTAELLRSFGIDILAWYFCPHAPATACECRKPLPGLAHEAARDWGVRLHGSYVVGDKQSDVELADAIGGTGLLLGTGHGGASRAWAQAAGRPVFTDLLGAAHYIEGRR